MSLDAQILESLREILWDPEILQSVYYKCYDDDVEILKASLMLQSVLVMFRAMRIQQKSLTASLKRLSDERSDITFSKNDLEGKVQLLQVECDSLRQKLEDAIAHRDSVTEELKRLQQQLAQKVDERAKSIFFSCLKKNKATTVLDWMTQMHLETQNIHDEEVVEKGKHDDVYHDSPDFIGATPDSDERRGNQGLHVSKASRKCKVSGINNKSKSSKVPGLLSTTPVCSKCNYLSSPDEIADTPNAKDFNKLALTDIRTNKNIKSLQITSKSNAKLLEPAESPEIPHAQQTKLVLSLDTQEVEDEYVAKAKPATLGNFVIPESFHPEDFDMDINDVCKESTINNSPREDPPSKTPFKSIADISINVDFPSTPEKKNKPISDGSPILGSGRKTMSQKCSESPTHSISSSPSLLGDQRTSLKSSSGINKKRSAKLSLDKSRRRVEKESLSLGGKKYKQSFLKFENEKCSSDISQFNEFNRGQRRKNPLNLLEEAQLIEEEQLQRAVEESLKDFKNNCENTSMDDTDITFFDNEKVLQGNVEACVGKEEPRRSKPSNTIGTSSNNDVFFQPLCASTAKVESQSKFAKSPQLSKCKSSQLLSPEKNFEEGQTQFNPICASTEKGQTQNSALDELVGLLNCKEKPSPIETSFDRLPRKRSPSPSYKYKENTVRKKADRMRLNAWDCPECRDFNRMAGYDVDDPKTKHLLKRCSRHRSKHGMRRPSPEGFWNPNCPPTPKPIKHPE